MRNTGKSKRRKVSYSIIAYMLLLMVLAGAAYGALAGARTEPVNEIRQKANSSLMLTADGSRLSVSADVINNKETDSGKTDKDNNEENENKNAEGNKKTDKDDKDAEDTGSRGNGKNNGSADGTGKTDIIYFTTTIKDGETVTSKEYSFGIKHKISTLTPVETRIYINGNEAECVKDARTGFNILLSEGRNKVRVQVIYENETGQKLSPYKNYTINVDTRHLVIITSLNDGQNVENAYMSFTAYAAFGEEDVDLVVLHEGNELFRNDGVYETELKEGANRFKMSAEYGVKHKAEEIYIIYYIPPEGLHIETDLKDQTVKAVDPEFTFRAAAVGGSSETEFTVTFNNKTVTGNDGVYNVTLLPQGEKAYNVIRLRARDGKEEASLTFNIKYIPQATPQTEPKLTHINIKNEQTVKKKNPFVLELAAEDYKGRTIYFDGMEVYLNGEHQILRETKPYVTYKLNLTEGKNIVRIKITDNDGRIKEYTYTLNYTAPADNEKTGTVTISMDANVIGLGTLISSTQADVTANDTLASVIVRTLQAKGFGCSYSGSTDSGFYLAKINRSGIGNRCNIPEALKKEIDDFGITWKGNSDNPQRAADSLGDEDYTTQSGWLILVDGSFISTSASEIDPKDGSIIKVRYTIAHGMDIGGSYQGNTFVNTY